MPWILRAVIREGRGVEQMDDVRLDGMAPCSLRRRLVLIDASCVTAAWLAAHQLIAPVASAGRGTGALIALASAFGSLLAIVHERLYLARVCGTPIVETAHLARAAVAAGLVSFVLSDVVGRASVAAAVVGAGLSLLLTTSARGMFNAWLRAERAAGRFTRAVAVVGRNGEAGEVLELLSNHPEMGYRVRGLIGDEQTARRHGVPWMGPTSGATSAVRESGVGGVILSGTALPATELNDLLRSLGSLGVHIQLSSGLQRMDGRRIRVTRVGHEPFLYIESPPASSSSELVAKRLLDVVVASVLLLVAAPLLVVAAIAVNLEDGGSVLFRQTRVGRGGRPFTLYKLRTMCADAEDQLAELRGRNERSGPLFKMGADPRVTRVGRVLRATSIDELPQLVNVILGSMSLVGPRPALPDEVAMFDSALLDRHRMRPGVTGLWQLEARDNPSFLAYRNLDLFYVENWSLMLDLVILISTVPTLLARSLRPSASPALAGSQ